MFRRGTANPYNRLNAMLACALLGMVAAPVLPFIAILCAIGTLVSYALVRGCFRWMLQDQWIKQTRGENS